jgi:MoxR-like ATPase
LSDFQVSVPELGTIEAKSRPLAILTSNNSREVSDALKRRCLHLFIDFPDREQEEKIVRLKVPELEAALAEQVVALVQKVRRLDLKKAPSISETLDWAKSLAILNVDSLGEEVVHDTLSTIFKYEADIRKAEKELKDFVSRRQAAEQAAEKASANTSKDDILH